MRTIGILVGLLAVVFLTETLPGDDVCIPDPITVNTVEGTVYFDAGGKQEPLSDVIVEVAPYGFKKVPIATAVTKSDGKFSLSQVPSGRYNLTIRHAVVIGLQVETRVKRSKRKKDNPNVIQIVLRNDPSKYCAGATVAVVRKH